MKQLSKKILAFGLAAMMMTAALTGCSGDQGGNTPAEGSGGFDELRRQIRRGSAVYCDIAHCCLLIFCRVCSRYGVGRIV